MHNARCSGLVHWDDPEGWNGEGGERGFQDGEHVCTRGLGTVSLQSIWLLATNQGDLAWRWGHRPSQLSSSIKGASSWEAPVAWEVARWVITAQVSGACSQQQLRTIFKAKAHNTQAAPGTQQSVE